METAIRNAISKCRNRMWINLDKEVNEAIKHVHLASVLVNKEPESITMLTIAQTDRMINMSFGQALNFIFPVVPSCIPFDYKIEAIKPKLKLKKKSAPILLKKKKVIPGKLF